MLGQDSGVGIVIGLVDRHLFLVLAVVHRLTQVIIDHQQISLVVLNTGIGKLAKFVFGQNLIDA